jgi:hypothetical protein
MNELPAIGSVAKYRFRPPFDPLDGVYRLERIYAYNDLTNDDGIDFVADLYTPLSLTQEDFNDDSADFVGNAVIRLSKVNLGIGEAATVLVIPAPLMSVLPDITVSRYEDFVVSINIGAFKSTEEFSWLLGELRSMAAAVTGTTNDVVLLTNGPVYLTAAEYATIVSGRAAQIEVVKPLFVTNQEKEATIAQLRSRIQYLEEIVGIQQGTPP